MVSDWYVLGLIALQHFATVGDFLIALMLANVRPGPEQVADLYRAWRTKDEIQPTAATID